MEACGTVALDDSSAPDNRLKVDDDPAVHTPPAAATHSTLSGRISAPSDTADAPHQSPWVAVLREIKALRAQHAEHSTELRVLRTQVSEIRSIFNDLISQIKRSKNK